MKGLGRIVPLLPLLLLAPRLALAHKPSDSYLTLRPAGTTVEARWDIAVRDLDHALGLDADGDGAVTWGEVRRRESAVVAQALSGLAVSADGRACAAEARPLQSVEHSDGGYLVLPIAFRCPQAPRALTVDYRLFFAIDPQHRGIVRLDDGSERTLVLGPRDGVRTLALGAGRVGPSFVSFVGQGVGHIWGGLDHVLFLIALLLPSVLRRTGGAWTPVPQLRSAAGDVARIVTAFTAAHSLTLSLATLGLVSVPARLIEPGIAASVALAAANNVRPLFGPDRWVVAFALGLLHGFGFSSVLADAGLVGSSLARALVGFNVGVELGQLAIVGVFVPAAFLLRHTGGYRRLALVGGSLAITAVSLVWVVQRITTG
jgi:hypothetical protein